MLLSPRKPVDVDISPSAFNETLAALKAAEKAVSALQNFDLTNFTQDATIKAFSVAESLLEESFKSFNVRPVLRILSSLILSASPIAGCRMAAQANRYFFCIQEGHGTYGTAE